MSQLLSASETYHAQLSVEIAEGREREARDAVKREQDLAFEMAQKVRFILSIASATLSRFLWFPPG